ncbi:type II toxin-antitoxin system VapC family toxin [Limnofasciculus baicalensis]|uniref:Type II toxin-antitoxin system VapC family toxin n=1 Tax=Limnofasciculus baicalensis BBK-W-15 TaxID=2699891 RepID=A0AAE3GPG8_9CYAN|nr:type II toxin-antitoxin system VapC family toxin [Limnofasciculus baicalensis]MCP2728335.1 type II toxin-antitoxin system VapC family toxin [Limnofasciculus baicalensis BBK-W-15]
MSLWILDTDHLTLWQNNHPLVKQGVNRVNNQNIAITIISVEEQMRGWLNLVRQSSQSSRQLWAYKGLQDGVAFFNQVNVLEFNQDAYDCYTELVSQRIRIGTQDLRIAAIAISSNGILVTRNRRDFERVPGLIFEDWTIDLG